MLTRNTETITGMIDTYKKISAKNRMKKGKVVSDIQHSAGGELVYTDQDALQDAMVKYLSQSEGQEINPDYIPAMAHQARIDSYRKETRRGHLNISDYSEMLSVIDQDDMGLIDHVKQHLSSDDKGLFTLYYVDYLTAQEIANKINMSLSTVKRSLSRINNTISGLNLKALVDARFAISTPGAEKHKLSTDHGFYERQCPNDWDLWQGQSDFSDYEPQERLIHTDKTPVNAISYKVKDYYAKLAEATRIE